MECAACRAVVPPGSRYCPGCGIVVPPSAAPPVVRAQEGFRRPAIVSLIAVLDAVAGIGMAGLGLLVGGVGLSSAEGDSGPAIVIGGIFLAIGVLLLLAAAGLWALKPWGRWLQVALSVLLLPVFPVGTVAGVLALVYLLRRDMDLAFAGRPLAPDEAARATRAALGDTAAAGIAVALVVLLFGGVAFTGIIAAIAIPNLLNAIQRGKQKRTVADMQTIAAAVESYAVDHNFYPVAADADALAILLEPTYVAVLPRRDGWNHPFAYSASPDPDGAVAAYLVASAGKDGAWEADPAEAEPGPTTDFDADIVLADGGFVRWPEGPQGGSP